MKGDLLIPSLYEAARSRQPGPLVLGGATTILDGISAGRRGVVMLTGFRIPPSGVPETDGIIGSAVVACALLRATEAQPILVCEPEVEPALRAALESTGVAVIVRDAADLGSLTLFGGTALVVTCGLDADLVALEAALARFIDIGACLAIERPGRNAEGYYHFAGGLRVEDVIAPLDDLYLLLRERGVATVAIGDFGNELGMGILSDVVAARVPSGQSCGCGCGGGVACPTEADVTIACAVSDWGAYALAAMIGHLCDRPEALVSAAVYRRTVEAANREGAIDGTSRLAIPHIDGIAFEFNQLLVEFLRGIVAYPARPSMDNANRRFAAQRLTAG
jgi:hypothetical protein